VIVRLYERLLTGGARFRSTTSWLCVLLYHYFQKDIRRMSLLLFFLHQIRSITSICSTCRLLETTPPVPPTLVLPLGTTWNSLIYVMLFLFLYRLSVNTINPYTTIMMIIFTRIRICFMIFKIKIYRKMPKSYMYPVGHTHRLYNRWTTKFGSRHVLTDQLT
jgi:hypothetical protein